MEEAPTINVKITRLARLVRPLKYADRHVTVPLKAQASYRRAAAGYK